MSAGVRLHGVMGPMAEHRDAENNSFGLFVPKGTEVAWLWTDSLGIMADEPANDPS